MLHSSWTKLLSLSRFKPVTEKRTSELKLIEDMAEKLQNDSKQFAYQTRNIKRIEKQCSPYEPNIAQSNKPSVRSQFKNLHSTLKSEIIKLKSKDRSKVRVLRCEMFEAVKPQGTYQCGRSILRCTFYMIDYGLLAHMIRTFHAKNPGKEQNEIDWVLLQYKTLLWKTTKY